MRLACKVLALCSKLWFGRRVPYGPFLEQFGRLRRRTGGREDKYFLGGGVGGDATWLGILSTLLQNDGKAELRVAVRRSTTGVLDFVMSVCV